MQQMKITGCQQETQQATANPEGAASAQSKESDERGTPHTLINALLKANNGLFEIDAASGAEPKRIGLIRLTQEDDALTCSWDPSDYSIDSKSVEKSVTEGSGWLNPPFSLGKKFGRKASQELKNGSLDYLLFLCSAQSVSDDWFHDYILPHAEYICLPENRLKFTNTGNNPQIPCIIASLGDTPSQIVSLFHERGECLELVEQTDVQEELFNFIESSAHSGTGKPGLISTSYRTGEPMLDGVGRGDRLELSLRDDVRGYDSIDTDDGTLEVEVVTWTETEDRWEIMTTLERGNSPFDGGAFVLIYVNKEGPSAFTVSHQVGERSWEPTPVKDIKTITNKIEWNSVE